MRTARIEALLREAFPDDAYAPAAKLIDRIGQEMVGVAMVENTDRVEAAALTYANGDLQELEQAVTLALVDRRDLLFDVGG